MVRHGSNGSGVARAVRLGRIPSATAIVSLREPVRSRDQASRELRDRACRPPPRRFWAGAATRCPKGRVQDVDALLPRLAQVRAEHRRLEAAPEPADPCRGDKARRPGLPETERPETEGQAAAPESEPGYPGSGVSAQQLQAMKASAPRVDPPESVTDAASRKQAALAAMTRDRPAAPKPSETTSAQADQADHQEPIEGAAPPRRAPDREMD